jgi:6-phosphogluconolactonase (cycloisomerase 2 family)
MLQNARRLLLVFVALVAGVSACAPVAPPPAPARAVPGKPTQSAKPTVPRGPTAPGERASGAELTLVEAVNRGDLSKVVRSAISSDGRFLYAASWNPGRLAVFGRDLASGRLTHVQTIGDKPEVAGATSIALSPDGRLVAVAAFHSRNVILFRRDPQSGRLTQLETAGGAGQGMAYPVSAVFSPDGKFVCVADDGGRPGPGGVRIFRLERETLVETAMDEGRDRCYYGARSAAFHPDGKTLFVACCRPGSLVVADFDPKTGATKVRQILWAGGNHGHDFSRLEVGDVTGIRGVTDVAISTDGRFATTCSGRFGGDTGVTSFQFGADGHLSFVQAIQSAGKGVGKFQGGNQIALSPDGRSVYAAGTLTGVVACAARDPQTGKLTPGPVFPDGGPPGAPAAPGRPGGLGAAGITISPDGRFVYVATEDKSTLSVFERKMAK